jgi:glycosyltransferase involved in cell wall biosynthesis
VNIGLIIDPYEEKTPSGLGHGLLEQARALVAEDDKNSYTLFFLRAPKQLPSIPGNHWHAEVLGGNSIFLNKTSKLSRSLDLYIFLTPIMPLLFFPKKSIVLVHDFAYLEMPAVSLRNKLSAWMLYMAHYISLLKATTIIAVSHSSKESALKHFSISPDKIHVIYNGFAPYSHIPKKIETPEPFFLFVGVLKERKNVDNIIRGFAHFANTNKTHSLVIAGNDKGEYAASLKKLTYELGLSSRIRFLGYVTDAEREYLYTQAFAFVFPSLIEGFGIPVLEAMHKGVPVITSNKGALAEVAGDAALLVDPLDPAAIAEAMESLVADKMLREEYARKGRERAAHFSWQKTAREMLELF